MSGKRGRKPLSIPSDVADQVKRLCLLGASLRMMAEFFGVSLDTFRNWLDRHEHIKRAYQDGRLAADARVAHALYHRAIGMSVPEEKVFVSNGEVIRVEVMKHYPPDVKAAKYWLSARRPEEWRETKEVNIGGQEGNPVRLLAQALQGSALPIQGEAVEGDDALDVAND